MIICVSANPAIDRRVRVRKLMHGAVNRAASAESFAGGKAAHVAMAAHALGGGVVWIGFLGGATGGELECQMNGLGIPTVAVRTKAQTRTNDEIIDEDGNITEILEPGGDISHDELEQMYGVCQRKATDANDEFCLVLSGSLPPGVPLDFYSRMISLAREGRSKVILDTSGDALRSALPSGPDLVKPNREEAENLVGFNIDDPDAAIKAAMEVQRLGARTAVISLGSDGLIWSDGDSAIIASPPPVDVVSTVGSGDATVAGFAVGHVRKMRKEETIRLAVACGAANCLAKLPGQIDVNDVNRLLPLVTIRNAARGFEEAAQ